MFEYISGKLASVTPATAVVDCGGVGYLMEITLTTYSAIQGLVFGPTGKADADNVRLWVHEIIREDAHQLYGFFSPAEREMFRLLISVNGVGAATARMMLSSLTVEEVQDAIVRQDAKLVQRVKGVGAKTAQRIVMELQDKVSATGVVVAASAPVSRSKEEALGALVMLGFPKAAADKVLQPLDGSLSVEALVKEALKRL